IMDDITPLRQVSGDVVAKDVHLYQPSDAYRVFGTATIHYWLKRGGQKVTLEFLDGDGKVIRTFTSDPDSTEQAERRMEQARLDSLASLGVMPASAREEEEPSGGFRFGPRGSTRATNRAGANSFTWDMRYPAPASFKNLIMWAAGIFGPLAPPGNYTVRLTTGDQTESKTFALKKDPRSQATQADLDEQFAFLIRIRDKTSDANNAVRTIRNLKAQIAARVATAPAGRKAALERIANPLTTRLSAVEGEIYQVRNQSNQDPLNFPIKLNNQIAALSGVVASVEAKPTRQSYEVYDLLAAELDAQLATLHGLLSQDLAALNTELGRLGLERVVPSTAEM
ncbi:MAG: glycosyl hydrolase, partial [Gemmatimonadales bacterium]